MLLFSIKMSHFPDNDEKILLSALNNGDHEAFETLYNTYSARIYGKLLKMTRAESLADELLQDTFIKLWENREYINPNMPVKAWLYRVAENEVYGLYRRIARDQRLQQTILDAFSEAYLHIEEDIYLQESRELLEKAIEQLTPQRKAVFSLCKLEGKSYEETARLLNLSVNTVRNHLAQATSIVRRYIFSSRERTAILITAFFMGRF